MGYKTTGYPTEFDTKSGGTWPTMPKGNTARPQNYTGEYSLSNIKWRGDGKDNPQVIPQQGFRKELPNPSKPDYATVEYEPDDSTPTTQAAIYRTHR